MKTNISIFMDGANLSDIQNLIEFGFVSGITTNPTLMNKSGVEDYETFGRTVADLAGDIQVSFEVLSTDPALVLDEANKINAWGDNVWVKIPIVTGKGKSLIPTIVAAQKAGIRVNITAVFSTNQISMLADVLHETMPVIVSIFAGRIADTGTNPADIFRFAKKKFSGNPNVDLLWASTRQVYSIVEAEECGADIITVSPDILSKMHFLGKDLEEYSAETVKMFEDDASASGLSL
ncbi:transaldolase [Alphaproteobacteria bacterium]|nr:transaldolase [Alphaproteobacteria bacterium]